MKLYIKQKVFSWGDKFHVYDENENEKYFVKGEVLTIGKKLHVYDPNEEELAFIHQKVLSFLPKYFIGKNGEDVAQVAKKFTFFHQAYTVEGLSWTVTGDFLAHTYEIRKENDVIASISKKWVAWGDTYEIDIAEGTDELMALCVVLIIDAVLAANNAQTASYRSRQ